MKIWTIAVRRIAILTLTALSLWAIVTPAQAVLFGFSQGPVSLVTDLGSINSLETGWYRGDGLHRPNGNYIAAAPDELDQYEYRDFFVFDLSALSGIATSASLVFNSYLVTTNPLYTLRSFDGDVATLLAGTAGVAGFDALGSGTFYADRVYSFLKDSNRVRSISLDAAAINAINAGGTFAIAGAVSAAPTPAPEPATWLMMLSGFGLVGAAMRRRQDRFEARRVGQRLIRPLTRTTCTSC